MNIISLQQIPENGKGQAPAKVPVRQGQTDVFAFLSLLNTGHTGEHITVHATQRDLSRVDRLMADARRCLSKRLISALLLLLAALTLSAYRHFSG